MFPYTEHEFPTKKRASAKAKQLSRKLGYAPSIFKVTTPQGKRKFSVIEPK